VIAAIYPRKSTDDSDWNAGGAVDTSGRLTARTSALRWPCA